MKVAPETSFKFLFFEYGKQTLARDPGNVTILEKFVCGGIAGCAAQFLIYPLEVLKTRMSVSRPGHYRGFWDCLTQIYTNRGIRGLYKGCGTSSMGILPYAGVDLMINSQIREQAGSYYRHRGQEPGLIVLLGAGMLSSSCAMIATYPLNLIRTRLQASGMTGAPFYENATDCFYKTIAKDGPLGLYRGFTANLMKVLPSTSISYAVYDVLRNGGKMS
jgi:solute carrier family 25 (mitochondrial phosphate transporter), member 23/24/25/41